MTQDAAASPIRIQLHRELDERVLRGAISGDALFDPTVLDALESLDRDLFTEAPFSREHIERELRGRRSLCILFAVREEVEGHERGDAICGYKVGHELTSKIFFSFLGGVRPRYRGQGIASRLMAEQHRLARSWGYSVVRTHTRNEFRSMLLLNIRSGFDVTGVNFKSDEAQLGIILEKRLGDATPKG